MEEKDKNEKEEIELNKENSNLEEKITEENLNEKVETKEERENKEETDSIENKNELDINNAQTSVESNCGKNVEGNEEFSKTNSKKQKIKDIIFHIIIGISIVLFSAAISPKTLQNDTYYTITIGDYIYHNGVGNLTDDLYSIHGLPYTYPHWLYDLCIFTIYNAFGHEGIYASTMILSAILGLTIYTLCNKKSKNKIISWIITIGAMYVLKSFIAARAQLVTFILFALAVLCIEQFLETKQKRYAIALVIIPLLIANLHCAVFPFYYILFLPYIGEYFFLLLEDSNIDLKIRTLLLKIARKFTEEENRKELTKKIDDLKAYGIRRKEKIQELRDNPYKVSAKKNHIILLLISVMLFSTLTGFLNPAGDGAYTYLVKTMQGNTTDSINEHLPLTLVENSEFMVSVVLFIIVLTFTESKIRLSDLFMLGGMTFLSFFSRRQVSMFAIFCAPILANLLAQMFEKNSKDLFIKLEEAIVGWFGAVVVTCLSIIICTNIIKPTLNGDFVDTSSYPVDASEWILSNLDVDNIRLYNEYNYGSYLLYRGIPVFIDSRCDLYSPEFNGEYNKESKEYDGRDIFSDALNIPSLSVDYEEMFEEYDITHVILYSNAKLAMILEDDSNYKELYDKGNFKIFERLEDKAPALKR